MLTEAAMKGRTGHGPDFRRVFPALKHAPSADQCTMDRSRSHADLGVFQWCGG